MRAWLVVLALFVGACNCSRSAPGGTPATAPATPPPSPVGPNARVGVVYGRILLAEGATLPRWDITEIDRGPDRPVLPPECGPELDSDTLPVEGVGTPTLLANVMVSATGEREPFMAALGETRNVDRVVAIERCRLRPKLITATVGDTLVLENHTDLPFLPSAGPSRFHETLLPGQSRRVPLDHAALGWIRCTFSTGCGRSDMVVIFHPVHTVSGPSGRYELRHVPADQDVQLHAWHPGFTEATAVTRVQVGQRVEVDFVLRPKPPGQPAAAAAAAPAPPTPPGRPMAGPESDFYEGTPTPPPVPTPSQPTPPAAPTPPASGQR